MGMSNFAGGSAPTGMTPPSMTNMNQEPGIDPNEFLINYNDKFQTSAVAMFRDNLINQTMGVLIGKNKPNALLVGSAGVGKTKIAEDIARRLANDDASVPDQLKGCTIWELPLSNIVSGSCFVGDVEKKVDAILDFASDADNKAILFIDEIHLLATSSTDTYAKIAQILKPALARGDIRVIGATTLQESSSLMNDPALNRRFSRLIVDELTQDQTVCILENSLAGFFMHYGSKLRIDTSILPTVVAISDQYAVAGNHRPDTAITLLDRVCADAIIARKQQEIALMGANDPTSQTALQALQASNITITEKQLRKTAMRLMTGNADQTSIDINVLTDEMKRIKGQDDITANVIERLNRTQSNLFPKKKPLSFLFAGSSGVGKTEVARIIAHHMTGKEPIILNMTEYHSSASINRIIGSPAGYVGSDSSAELPFDCLETNPYQVILLDEFEKADKSVQRLFMGALDGAPVKTAKGREIDFSKSIIIATTNASHSAGAKNPLGFNTSADNTADEKQNVVDVLSAWFDVELLNRFSDILTFHTISRTIYSEIVAGIYKTEIARIKKEYSRITLPDDLDKDTLDMLTAKTYVPKFGARPAKGAVQEYIETEYIKSQTVNGGCKNANNP